LGSGSDCTIAGGKIYSTTHSNIPKDIHYNFNALKILINTQNTQKV
jgi:hypothetical protein